MASYKLEGWSGAFYIRPRWWTPEDFPTGFRVRFVRWSFGGFPSLAGMQMKCAAADPYGDTGVVVSIEPDDRFEGGGFFVVVVKSDRDGKECRFLPNGSSEPYDYWGEYYPLS